MGQTAEKIDHKKGRKPTGKTLRGLGYTGNLAVFKQRELGIHTSDSRAAALAGATRTAASNLPRHEQTSSSRDHALYESTSKVINSSSYLVNRVAANNSFTTKESSVEAIRKSEVGQKRALVAAIAGSISVVAILGGVWAFSSSQPAVVTTASTSNAERGQTGNPSDTTATAANFKASVSGVAAVDSLTDAPISTASIDADQDNAFLASEPMPQNPTIFPDAQLLQQQVVGYQEEITWLTQQNDSLTRQVKELTDETLELNRELLDLELELARLSPTEETRIVYNFVNVPIGDGSSNSDSESYQAPVTYEQPDVYQQPIEYQQEIFYPEAVEAEYRDIYGYADTGAPVYDPETGLYLDPSMIDNGGQQYFNSDYGQPVEPNPRVIYPPVAPNPY